MTSGLKAFANMFSSVELRTKRKQRGDLVDTSEVTSQRNEGESTAIGGESSVSESIGNRCLHWMADQFGNVFAVAKGESSGMRISEATTPGSGFKCFHCGKLGHGAAERAEAPKHNGIERLTRGERGHISRLSPTAPFVPTDRKRANGVRRRQIGSGSCSRRLHRRISVGGGSGPAQRRLGGGEEGKEKWVLEASQRRAEQGQ